MQATTVHVHRTNKVKKIRPVNTSIYIYIYTGNTSSIDLILRADFFDDLLGAIARVRITSS